MDSPAHDTIRVDKSESPSASSQTSVASASGSGTWGEHDGHAQVNRQAAIEEFEELGRELSQASQAQSRRSGIFQSLSRGSHAKESAGKDEKDEKDAFHLDQFMREGHLEHRTASGEPAKRMGVVFKNLTVRGVGSSAVTVKTLPDAIVGTFGPDLWHMAQRWVPGLSPTNKMPLRTLLHDFTGVVRHGEMLLVLGRLGSGCTTFLKVVANQRAEFAAVEGEVTYGGMAAAEVAAKYRGEVVYNMEDDQHMASLTVWQTLRFALLTKSPRRVRGEVERIVDALLSMFGIAHTRNTVVGSAFVRGVSGGERKRVSIAETLAAKSTVACWDNATRGLDASTALDYARALRIMTDVTDRTTVTTLYQAGEEMYGLMDKVMVIDEGRMLFQGPAGVARAYFEELGFYAPPRMTTPDFLTSLCDVHARQFRPGWEARCPKTAAELEAAFRASTAYQAVLADVADFEMQLQETECADAKRFQEAVRDHKSRTVSKHSNYTVSFWRQVLACTRREFWLLLGDRSSLYTKFFIIISNALIVGSLFYNAPADTRGAFLRSGTAFFSILFLGWLQLAELIKALQGRDIVARHEAYAFYRPSAVVLARVLADVPLLGAEVVVFSIVVYFLTGLDVNAGKFFIYMLFVYTTVHVLTAMYRMFAAISPTVDDAVRFSGLALDILFLYTGYVISRPTLLHHKIWFGWLYYVNPLSYAYEAVVTNEFHDRTVACAPGQLVPRGTGIELANQGCMLAGAVPGGAGVEGDVYVAAQFGYSRGHLWRNFGVLIGFFVLYLGITMAATELISFARGGGGAVVFAGKTPKAMTTTTTTDEETTAAVDAPRDVHEAHDADTSTDTPLHQSRSIYTWEDLTYTVPTADGPKRLLNNVRGYARPGVMVALMGASGAGKTTLLQTLSQRQTVGVVEGKMLVDGRPLGADFQRGTGFVEQMDLHDETATVREALEFSAVLRQDRLIPRAERLAYVDRVVELLELQALQHAVVGSLGVEHKKRLTIGVELAARPSLLLFLDEPTSGLDAQSALSVIRFLRRLCAAGQAVVCTIHQPSAELLQQFDRVLALNPGGNVFYFGAVGHEGRTVVDYFAARGAVCAPGKNPAEFILETAARPGRVNWNEEWLQSDEYRTLGSEIAQMQAERQQEAAGGPTQTASTSFAAPTSVQILALTRRMFLHQWRSPSYVYGLLFTAVMIGIFNGFTFWQLGASVSDLQSRMFTLFVTLLVPPVVLNAVIPQFYGYRVLWELREHPARIYGWVAFCTSAVLSEIPHSIASSVLYFCAWYFPTGMPRDAPTAGYVFLMMLLFFLFDASWGQWICAFAPSFTVIANVIPFFLVQFSIFNGIVVPYAQLNVFWRYWIYYLNPSTYWVSGLLSAVLAHQPVVCAAGEETVFDPPAGQTCSEFAAAFVSDVGQGYLTNPNATASCGYCEYASGAEYLASLNISPSQKWRDFGIFLAFCVSNYALVFFFIYTVRVRRWSFGLSTASNLLGSLVGRIGGKRQ